jgi:hypothetical protein
MNTRKAIIFTAVLLPFLISSVYAQISVGLKEGDWVEYTGTYTGNPPDRYSESARIEILTIQGTLITVEINTIRLNGTHTSRTETFDLETGAPDFLIIPANLGPSDEIYHEELGNATIERVENYNFHGTTRELVYANVANIDFKWDRTTGIVIEIVQITETFTQTLQGVDTNIVQAQLLGLDPLLLYGIIIAVAIIIVVAVILVLRRKK